MKLLTIGLPLAIAGVFFSSTSLAISEPATKGSGYDFYARDASKKPIEIKVIPNDFAWDKARSSSKAVDDILGRHGVELVKEIMQTSSLYVFLSSLRSGIPALTKNLEYVLLLHEINLTNQKLDAILEANEKHNQNLSEALKQGLAEGIRQGLQQLKAADGHFKNT
jgi:hypothetical protein